MTEVAKIEEQPEAKVAAFDPVLTMIERAAADPNIDIDKFERLFAMREAMQDRIARQAFNAALANAQAEMAPVAKDVENSHTRSKYASLAAICEAVMPIIGKHGLGLSFATEPSVVANCVKVVCTVTHKEGHERVFSADVPIDGAGMGGKTNKTATQAYGSTLSYGRRYMTLLVFNIATGDDVDGNPKGGATISTARAQWLMDVLRAALEDDARELQMRKYLTYAGVDFPGDIPAARWAKIEESVLRIASANNVVTDGVPA